MLKVPVFYYHSIGNQGPQTLPADTFRQHLQLVREHGFTPITFSELVQLPADTDKKKLLVLSFDDGLLDNFEVAVPLLQEFGYTATFFVIPGFDYITRWVNPETSQWSDFRRSGFTIPFPSMKSVHRRELAGKGMEIASHSMSHKNLNRLAHKPLFREIRQSKSCLEDELGVPVNTFCYPRGRYTRGAINLLAEAGYLAACTTIPSWYTAATARFECGRFLVESPRLFRKILHWSEPSARWTGPVCRILNPPLKLRATRF